MVSVSVSLPMYDHNNQNQWDAFASKHYISKSADKSRTAIL